MTDGMYQLGPNVLSATALTATDPGVYEACPTCKTGGCEDCDYTGLILHDCDA